MAQGAGGPEPCNGLIRNSRGTFGRAFSSLIRTLRRTFTRAFSSLVRTLRRTLRRAFRGLIRTLRRTFRRDCRSLIRTLRRTFRRDCSSLIRTFRRTFRRAFSSLIRAVRRTLRWSSLNQLESRELFNSTVKSTLKTTVTGLVKPLGINPMNVFEKSFLVGRFSRFWAPGARNSSFWTSDSDSTQNFTLGDGF